MERNTIQWMAAGENGVNPTPLMLQAMGGKPAHRKLLCQADCWAPLLANRPAGLISVLPVAAVDLLIASLSFWIHCRLVRIQKIL